MNGSLECKICGSSTRNLYQGLFDERHGYPKIFGITQCTVCGFCRTEPSLKRENLKEVYQNYYPRNSLTVQKVKNAFLTARKKGRFKSWLDGSGTECHRYIEPGSRVLDVGCGNCVSLLMAKELGAQEVLGIEVDPNLSLIAEALGLNLHVGQLSTLPLEEGKFDFILARQVLEHEPEPEHLLLEMKERLKENGKLVLSFPNVNSFYRFIFKKKWLHWHVPYHVNHFSRRSLEKLVEKSGLNIVSVKTITPNSWLAYQMRICRLSIKLGQRDAFWDPGVSNDTQRRTSMPFEKLLNKLKRKINYLASFPKGLASCSINRFIDLISMGESFVVILSK